MRHRLARRQKRPPHRGLIAVGCPQNGVLWGLRSWGERRWSAAVTSPSPLDATRPWRVEGNLHPAPLRVNCGDHRHRPVRAQTPRQRRACSVLEGMKTASSGDCPQRGKTMARRHMCSSRQPKKQGGQTLSELSGTWGIARDYGDGTGHHVSSFRQSRDNIQPTYPPTCPSPTTGVQGLTGELLGELPRPPAPTGQATNSQPVALEPTHGKDDPTVPRQSHPGVPQTGRPPGQPVPAHRLGTCEPPNSR